VIQPVSVAAICLLSDAEAAGPIKLLFHVESKTQRHAIDFVAEALLLNTMQIMLRDAASSFCQHVCLAFKKHDHKHKASSGT
jgi:hypothetical protein